MTVITLALLVCLGIQTPSSVAVKAELDAAAYAYRIGEFDEAEQHARKAVELDPNNKTARMYLARTVQAQFRPGDTGEENLAKARHALEEYKNLLSVSPKDDEGFKAIAYLLGVLKEDQQLREWLLQRATDESFEPGKRAEAYIILASKSWNCSFKITEQIQTKVTTVINDKPKVTYRMPQDPVEFQTAQTCVSEGLTQIDHAIFLDLLNDSAWSHKYNLLLERSKLFEMEGKMAEKAEVEKLADEAVTWVLWFQKPRR